MRSPIARLAAVCLCALTIVPARGADIIPLPPERQEFASPQRRYVLVISSEDVWKSRKSTAELFAVDGERRGSLWIRQLPHEYGPRYALVGRDGSVLLVDEWINVTSRYAIQLIDPANRIVAQHDFDAIQRTLGIPAARIAATAKHGPWIVSAPVLDAVNNKVAIGTAGTTLFVDMSDGRLSVAKPS